MADNHIPSKDVASKEVTISREPTEARNAIAEIERLREALEPFAEAVEKADANATRMGFAPSFDEYATEWRFTFGQLRAARAAIHGGGEDL